jgi:hypothetical protein
MRNVNNVRELEWGLRIKPRMSQTITLGHDIYCISIRILYFPKSVWSVTIKNVQIPNVSINVMSATNSICCIINAVGLVTLWKAHQRDALVSGIFIFIYTSTHDSKTFQVTKSCICSTQNDLSPYFSIFIMNSKCVLKYDILWVDRIDTGVNEWISCVMH